MGGCSGNDVVDETLAKSREERIREYAFAWSEFRKANNCPGTAAGDWARAEHIVQAEDITREKDNIHDGQ